MTSLWKRRWIIHPSAIFATALGLASLSGCGSKNSDDAAATKDESKPADEQAESAPEAPAAVAEKGDAPAEGDIAVAQAPGKSDKVDFNGNDDMLKLARSSATSGGASASPPSGAPLPNSGGPGPAQPGAVMPGSTGPGGAGIPTVGVMPTGGQPGGAQAAAGRSGGGRAAPTPGGGGFAAPAGGGGNLPAPAGGGGGGAGINPGLMLGGGDGGGSPGVPGSPGGGSAPDFRNPVAGAKAFLAALKAKDPELLSEAVALRSVTEAHSEKHRELFKAIREKSLDPAELDDFAAAFEGMSVQDTNVPKSTGQLGVIVGKMKGRDHLMRTLFMRKEKAGWKVMDVSGEKEIKGAVMGGRKGGSKGR